MSVEGSMLADHGGILRNEDLALLLFSLIGEKSRTSTPAVSPSLPKVMPSIEAAFVFRRFRRFSIL